MTIHPARKAQIALLVVEKVAILAEYSAYINFFSKKTVEELFGHSKINKHSIDLKLGKKPLYGPIYSLELVELEILKTYIETNLANDFIFSSKSPAGVHILFV